MDIWDVIVYDEIDSMFCELEELDDYLMGDTGTDDEDDD